MFIINGTISLSLFTIFKLSKIKIVSLFTYPHPNLTDFVNAKEELYI